MGSSCLLRPFVPLLYILAQFSSLLLLCSALELFAFSDFQMLFYLGFSEPFEDLLFFGISSLCLYIITEILTFQEAILYKLHKTRLCKIQKYTADIHFDAEFH